jgi:branched-chain amino acid transport system substrate-binding protein
VIEATRTDFGKDAEVSHKNATWSRFGLALAAGVMMMSDPAAAQLSDNKVKIGVLGDQSSISADIGGKAAVLAAKMAVEDFGGRVLDKPIEVVDADFLMKPDNASSIARRWFESEQVDVIADLPLSSAGLAVQQIASDLKRTVLIAGAATSDLTGKSCSLYSTHWADDTYALASATAKAVVESGADTWYFIAADYALGRSIQRDATAVIEASGGKVVGSARHPIEATDFSSFLLQAQSSKAKVIGLASVGSNTINTIKQAAEFGITESGQKLAGFLVFLTDINSLGLKTAQKMFIAEGFYWDQNDKARTWSKRFFDQVGRMPTKQQAATYASISHYLRAVAAAGTDDATAVGGKMRELPVDFFGRSGSVRVDGRVLYDMTLYEVKAPAESKYPWDYYKVVREIPQATAFRPLDKGECPLAAK